MNPDKPRLSTTNRNLLPGRSCRTLAIEDSAETKVQSLSGVMADLTARWPAKLSVATQPTGRRSLITGAWSNRASTRRCRATLADQIAARSRRLRGGRDLVGVEEVPQIITDCPWG